MTTSAAHSASLHLLVAAIVAVATTAAAARSASECATLRRACAAFDLHLVGLIENAGEDDTIGGRELFEASLALLDARRHCAAGAASGLGIYGTIDARPHRSRR